MAWPQLDDFRWAIQEPANGFSDPELQSGEVVCDMFGMPKMASGNFACVYEIRTSNRRWAVRTFNHEVTDQQLRYQLVSEHLGVVGLPYMVRFQFQPAGLMVGGTWYPIVKMAWVEGVTLTRWVKDHRDDPEKIKDLAKDWRGMIGALYGLQMAHADLQQGNVLVTADDTLRLVDYDGMFVPSMQGKPAPELGHPNWNHPRRTNQTFGPYLDQFPGLVGYLSLLAIAAEPALLDEYCNDENLILSQADFAAPRNSAALHHLKMVSENGVKELTEALIGWCEHDVNYNTLENVATGGASAPLIHPGARPGAPRPEARTRPGVPAKPAPSRTPSIAIAAGALLVVSAGVWFALSSSNPGPSASPEPQPAAAPADAPAQPAETPQDKPAASSGAPVPGSTVQAANVSGASAPMTASRQTALEDDIRDAPSRTVPGAATPASGSGAAARPALTGMAGAPAETFEFNDASGYYNRGKQREGQSDWVGAESDYTKAIAMRPEDPMYYRERGNVRLRKEDLIGARLDYDKAIELDPRYSAAYNSRGVLKRRQGDVAGARADYDRAIELSPSEAAYFRNRANLRRQQGDLKGALEDYTRTIALDGKDSIAYNSRGVVREALGDVQGARADYDRAIELNPTEPSFFQNRSNLRRALGDLQGAQADLDRAVSLRSK
jgi:tetratricopeptide (TPR) repeat protein